VLFGGTRQSLRFGTLRKYSGVLGICAFEFD
jgi:hypothetical protein